MSDRHGKSVLVLGAGTMQLPAVLAARRRGWRVAVAAPSAREPAVALADEHLRCDLTDVPALVAAAGALAGAGGLDGVFTAGTDFSHSVACVAESLGLPGVAPEVAERATDKGRMRATLAAAGVPVPSYAVVGQGGGAAVDAQLRAAAEVPLPAVVKPVDNMGARGVVRVDSPSQLDAAIDGARAQSRSGQAVVEQYMAGPELSIDALVCDGRVNICGIADRDIRFPPYFIEMGHTLPSALAPAQLSDATEVFRAAIAAVGIRNGAAKGDVMVTDEGAKIGEIAARLSGGYMSGWTYPYATGVDLTGAGLEIAVGAPAPDLAGALEPRWQRVSAERAFLSIPGRVQSIDGTEEAQCVASVRDLFVRVASGQDVDLPTSNVEKCGNVIACHDSRDAAVEAALVATQTVTVRLEPGNDRTEAFLFGQDQRVGAFGDAGQRQLARIEAESAAAAVSGAAPPPPSSGGADAHGAVAVVGHPELLASDMRDWHGLQVADAAHRALELGRGRLVTAASGIGGSTRCIDRMFWRALLRGSVQGALYVLDRERRAGGDSEARCAA